eukprot:CAMPEP_0185024248 /NCGR_PEP_ID=MMETSP1103-20130426/7247_1 /TAXON_ID=36769 /ORGANISM="Paraphysomonas bandaiensis, Strain Caron Lab Isolate" /LENGTH=76 /DNA_ID=CAMNT_0027557167 /DNA_START=119 /DNA_END=349 /DNA_ORIENTATION=+
MDKWWTKHYHVDGQVTQHLSPFEQNITKSLFKDMPKKVFGKVVSWLLEAFPGLILGVTAYTWGNYEYERVHYNHRP